MEGAMHKMEVDYSKEGEIKLAEAEKLFQENKLEQAVEQVLLPFEKLTRLAGDMATTGKVLCAIVEMCFKAQRWQYLNDNMILLAKKRSLIKAAIAKMIKTAYELVEQTPNLDIKIALIESLRDITDGKIYVELERARLTLKLAHIKEGQNKIKEACTVLQDLQVETFGSMDRKEKVNFILEQIRFCIMNKDFIRAQIISKKVSQRWFKENPEDEEIEKIKIKFYRLMVLLKTQNGEYMEIARYYQSILEGKMISSNEVERKKAIKAVLIYCLLAKHSPEQVSLLNQTFNHPSIEDDLPMYKKLANMFITPEIIKWETLCNEYKQELTGGNEKSASMNDESTETDEISKDTCSTIGSVNIFENDKVWEDFKTGATEHNIRCVAKYYTQIRIERLSNLLSIDSNTVETHVSRLVNEGMIYAKIDRLENTINFQKTKNPHETLNNWGTQLTDLMNLVNQSAHLISKEYMLSNAKIGAN